MATAVSCVFAEEAEQSGSKFETVLLKKGSLIIKNFVDVDDVETTIWKMFFQAATLTDVETGSKYCAAHMTHYWYESKYSDGTSVGILDLEEIDGAITALKYIKEHASEMTDYTEIVYTASSGLKLGAYKDSSDQFLFFVFSSSYTAFIEMTKIDEVVTVLENVKAKLGQ